MQRIISNQNNTNKFQLFGNSNWLLYSNQPYLGITKKKLNKSRVETFKKPLLSHVK